MAHTCTNEDRIRSLEKGEAVMGVKIENLISALSTLTGWLKALVITSFAVFGAALLSGLGYLIIKWVEK